MSVSEMVILITATVGAVASAIVTVVNGIKVRQKLEVIHKDTNGNLGRLQVELMRVREQLRKERAR